MPERRDDLAHMVARQIAELRAARGLTQEALATRLDIATKNVQRFESGRQNLTLKTIERIAGALRVDSLALLPTVAVDGPHRDGPPSALSVLVDAGFAVVPASQPRQRPANSVPVVDLLAAAGSMDRDPSTVDVLGWTVLRRRGAPPRGTFVAQVRGASMAPRIPDGSVCLFGAARSPIEGRIALVAHHGITDSDIGGAYAIKKVGKLARLRDGRTRVLLRSLNASYPPVLLHTTEDDDLRVIAELIQILSPVT
jgi:UDP-N-acetylglucosamine 1-carboxyvinyltransferase